MARRLTCFARVGGILFALTLFVTLMPTAAAFTNGQSPNLVLGQPNFTSAFETVTASGMRFPTGVAVDLASGKVFIAESANNRVLRFASGPALVSGAAAEAVLGQPDFTSRDAATTASGMSIPFAVAVDSAGRLWVADTNNNRVLRFDDAASKVSGAVANGVLGQPDFTSGMLSSPTSISEMSSPFGVTVDSSGRLWVSDSANNRVLRFDDAANKANGANADGVLGQPDFTSFPTASTASGMRLPRGLAADSAGHLWVTDFGNSRVVRFDGAAGKPNGASADGVLGQTNFTNLTTAATASGMNFPTGVALDSIGRLWVVDNNNSRVLRFDNVLGRPNGASADGVLGQPDFTSFASARSQNGMFNPIGVAVGNAGSLWITDSSNVRVLRFDVRLTPTVTWPNPAAITYGTALSVAQLNASANIPGTFSYTPALGTVLNIGAGQTLSVLFTPTDTVNYSPATATVKIDVLKVPQTISFGPLASKLVSDPAFTISATASSGLPVSFSRSTPSICSVSGRTVTLLAAGTCTIVANQSGNASFNAAPPVARSFSVAVVAQANDPRLLYMPLITR